ncbi:hypothetical protein BC567DRAFT_234857 [Phyllosticta citribraziliensis]
MNSMGLTMRSETGLLLAATTLRISCCEGSGAASRCSSFGSNSSGCVPGAESAADGGAMMRILGPTRFFLGRV